MKKENIQKILTAIIVIAMLAIVGVVIYATYTLRANIGEQNNDNRNEINTNQQEEDVNKTEQKPQEEQKDDEKQEFEGKEEEESNKDNQISKDEKAIKLAKETYGEDDTVTFNIEQKKDNLYYVAVKNDATTILWYEIDTDTWKISEY